MPFLIISVLLQVSFVIHVLKTGRNTTWIWVIVMLPLAGSIAYFILEILPDLTNSRTGRKAGRKVESVINPNKDINEAAERYAVSDTIENSMRLAEECYEKELFGEAKKLYEKCLKGPYSEDPDLLFGIAKTHFQLDDHGAAKAALDTLIVKNPDYKNQDAHLIYARSLESLGEITEALDEYEALYNYYSGPDAAYYFALFLKAQNQRQQSDEMLEGILNKATRLGQHYRDTHKNILARVRKELGS